MYYYYYYYCYISILKHLEKNSTAIKQIILTNGKPSTWFMFSTSSLHGRQLEVKAIH